MEIERICNKCGEVNKLNERTVLHEDTWTNDREYVRLTYYRCCRCKEVVPLQLDNEETLQIFEEYKKLFKDALMKQIKKQTVGKKAIKRKDKLTKQLRNKRTELEEIHKGKKLYDKNGKVFINVLTNIGAGDIINGEM